MLNLAARLRDSLPRGNNLDQATYVQRHRLLQGLVAVQIPLVFAFGLWRHFSLTSALVEAVAVPGVLLVVSARSPGRRVGPFAIAAALAWFSAAIVHFSGGSLEAHFAFFIVIGFVALYQDWAPFLFAIAFTMLIDGLGAQFGSSLIFNDPAAARRPLAWALIHGSAIVCVSIAQIVSWRAAELAQRRSASLAADLAVAHEHNERRRAVGGLLVSLARRNQSLLERQLELIDELERRETNPEAMAELFRLDHFATRMRRNAESLLVLAGHEPVRRWTSPLPASEVIRGAIAEIDDYERVDLDVAADPPITGGVVSDLVHLLAELIENGTAFSPPDTRVAVTGRRARGGYQLRIEDHGVGMTEVDREARNSRLAEDPELDINMSRMLGLQVVARLAKRHSIRVRLEENPYGGTNAAVLLPTGALGNQGGETTMDIPGTPVDIPLTPIEIPLTPVLAALTLMPSHEFEPAAVEPAAVEPAALEPAALEPAAVEPAAVEPAAVEPAAVEPAAVIRADPALRFLRAGDPRADGYGEFRKHPAAQLAPPSKEMLSRRPRSTVLARRIPTSHLAPGILINSETNETPAAVPDAPEAIRTRLSHYQAGMRRGRVSAPPESASSAPKDMP